LFEKVKKRGLNIMGRETSKEIKAGVAAIIVCVMFIVTSFSGCEQTNPPTTEKILIFGSAGDVDKLDPASLKGWLNIHQVQQISNLAWQHHGTFQRMEKISPLI
jgi:hypothetical protein